MCYDQVLDKDGKKPVTRSIEYGRSFNRYMPTLYYLNLFDEKMDARYDDVFQQAWICNNTNSTYISPEIRLFSLLNIVCPMQRKLNTIISP